jgi:hypothetical protein
MALISTASSSSDYITTVVVQTTAYSIPSGHYGLLKAGIYGASNTTSGHAVINAVNVTVGGSAPILVSSGIRFPAGTVFYTNNSNTTLFIEVYAI